MEFGLRRHVTNLIGVSEKKKINKREKEKQSTFKDKTLLSKIEQENVSFVLGNQKTPLQDKEKKKKKNNKLVFREITEKLCGIRDKGKSNQQERERLAR